MDNRGKIGLTLGFLALLLWGKKLMAKKPLELQLSPNFKLSEFLRSTSVPEVKYYHPTPKELANLQLLVDKVLQPLRNEFGPIRISGGMRPMSVRNSKGQNFTEALRQSGYEPSPEGDHTTFNGVDIQLVRTPSAKMYLKAYHWLKAHPSVRQVILYLKTDPDTQASYADHIHVSSVTPEKPSLYYSATRSDDFAYAKLDNKRVTEVMV